MKINLHNHTTFSDGKLTAADVVQAAIEAGLTHVGITDHFASQKLTTHGVEEDTVGAYVGAIRDLAARYDRKIKVLAGIEVDFSPVRMDFALLRAPDAADRIFREFDFVLFEYVGDPEWTGGSLEDLVAVRPLIPCPVGLAHCHFERDFANFMPQTVAAILEQNSIFLELCPSERNASMVLADANVDRAKIHHELQALHRQMETLSKELSEMPSDTYLLDLRNQIDAEMNAIYERFKKVPSYRTNGRFTRSFFPHLRGRKVALSIGTDTHDSIEEVGQIGDAVKFIEEQMLQRNVITNFFWKAGNNRP